jgi:hypothetical protein
LKINIKFTNDYEGTFAFGDSLFFQENPAIRIYELESKRVEIDERIKHRYKTLCRRLKLTIREDV